MSHHIEIDHRRNGHDGRHRIVNEDGRTTAVFEPVAEAARNALSEELARSIRGEVRFDAGSRALYSTDASNYRQVPLGVVVPRDVDDVVTTVAACHRHGVPLGLRGGGTSLAGEACNVAVMIDFSKHLDHVTWLDPDRRLAEVEPGCILDTLRDQAEEHHLTFGPDPATHDHNTLGGMIGNNSCGTHSVMAGRTSDNVESLDVLTYDGLRMTVGQTSDEALAAILAEGGRRAEIYRALDEFRNRYGELFRREYPKIPRRVSGYENLDELLPEKGFNVARALVGTEATCVTVLGARLNLVPSPRERVLAIIGFEDIFAAADAVPEVLEFAPIALEGIDEMLIRYIRVKDVGVEDIRILPEGHGWLLAQFGGDTVDEAAAAAGRLADGFADKSCDVKVVREKDKQAKIWAVREAALAATAHIPGNPENWPGWEDSAVARDKLGDYLRELKDLFHQHGYRASVYGHFGDGLVHCRIPFDLRHEKGLRDWQAFLEEAADLVAKYGGSLSGEHGDGQARAALLGRMYSPELMQAFREFKAIWDPQGRMNPGKVIDPFPITSNLRVGPAYQPPELHPTFAYPEDGGSFARAALRCVGVGKCRRPTSDEGVMCPSYMVTREEKHSTRGRARLLFEMLHGGAINDGWRSREVEEALDLCLACKGCKSDCPVQVDMATYKAEFRSKHYQGRLRPRAAYSMGLIHRWSRIGSAVPWLANFATGTPGLSSVTKWIGGIAQARSVPRYAPQTFMSWFHGRTPPPSTGDRRVVLWPDTFNNHFRPQTAIAATESLEALGYHVVVPKRHVCCGRPLYDWGRLDMAKDLWRNTFETLGDEIREGTPVVGLEPACVSAFRDELPGLFHGHEQAQWLSKNTFFLTEFLEREGCDLGHGLAGTEALVHLHCHHHAVLDAGCEKRVLGRMGLKAEIAPSGCCGMAGSFGFEAEKYEVSMASAERVLLPEVRKAPNDKLIITNGFSCREQIEQASQRKTVHVAEVIRRAVTEEVGGKR